MSCVSLCFLLAGGFWMLYVMFNLPSGLTMLSLHFTCLRNRCHLIDEEICNLKILDKKGVKYWEKRTSRTGINLFLWPLQLIVKEIIYCLCCRDFSRA